MQRLPPLNSLRVFEVAAELKSFARAAEALCVTNAAVSHQIRLLEEFLGLALFERRNNRLKLTAAGEDYLPRVREAFNALREATGRLQGASERPLRVAAPAAFAAKWLVPRLHRFLALYPSQQIELLEDADGAGAELRIAERQQTTTGGVCERLLSSRFFPVCSAVRAAHIDSAEALRGQPLLCEAATRGAHVPTWQRWFDELGLEDSVAVVAQADTLQTLQAAIDDHGVALAPAVLVAYDLAAGRLVAPLAIETSLRLSWYLLYDEALRAAPGLQHFRGWLLDEAATMRD